MLHQKHITEFQSKASCVFRGHLDQIQPHSEIFFSFPSLAIKVQVQVQVQGRESNRNKMQTAVEYTSLKIKLLWGRML